MFRFRVEDKDGNVLGIKNKYYEASELYRKNLKKLPKIIALWSGPESQGLEEFQNES